MDKKPLAKRYSAAKMTRALRSLDAELGQGWAKYLSQQEFYAKLEETLIHLYG